jgi:DNA repair protein RecO (recombination protein O)
MLNKTKAIVLHQIKYGDSGLIVTLYTENFGRISCLVHQSKSKKTKYPSTFFQPLSLLEVDLYYKASREIQRFKEVNLFYHYTTVPFHIAKSTVAIFLAEALYLSLREEESNPFLFSFISHALQLFDLKETNPLFHPWFLIHLSRHLGFFLEADHFDKKDSYGFNSDGLKGHHQ